MLTEQQLLEQGKFITNTRLPEGIRIYPESGRITFLNTEVSNGDRLAFSYHEKDAIYIIVNPSSRDVETFKVSRGAQVAFVSKVLITKIVEHLKLNGKNQTLLYQKEDNIIKVTK